MALYADITGLNAPSQAVSGSRVDLSAVVKNIYSYPVSLKVTTTLEYNGGYWTGIVIPTDSATVASQASYTFSGYFYMPSVSVVIHIYSYWYGSDGQWHFDDEMTRPVTLASVGQPSITEFRIADFIKV